MGQPIPGGALAGGVGLPTPDPSKVYAVGVYNNMPAAESTNRMASAYDTNDPSKVHIQAPSVTSTPVEQLPAASQPLGQILLGKKPAIASSATGAANQVETLGKKSLIGS